VVTDDVCARALDLARRLEPTLRELRLWPTKPDAQEGARSDLAVLLEPWLEGQLLGESVEPAANLLRRARRLTVELKAEMPRYPSDLATALRQLRRQAAEERETRLPENRHRSIYGGTAYRADQWDRHKAELRRRLGGVDPITYIRQHGALPAGLPHDPGELRADEVTAPTVVEPDGPNESDEEEPPW
jgi:hypothetical protein